MILLWFITGASLVIALAALRQARRTARRLEQLSQTYWELKYQHGELRAQLHRPIGEPHPSPGPVPQARTEAFVPLTSLRR
jgi:hypothetical protein